MSSLKKEKQKAWIYYNRWRKEKTYSPALKQNIVVSLKGWKHITGATGAKKRNFKDIYRRLKLLPDAKKVIKKSTTIQNIVRKYNKDYYVIEAMVRGKSTSKRFKKVRVILIEDKKGNKIFYSVMDKKRKN